MKTKSYFIAALIGLILGYAGGLISTNVYHYNESRFGSSYGNFRFEWLALPGLPGSLITQLRADYDWQVDEAWLFRHQIRAWNAFFWSGIAVVSIPVLSKLSSRLTPCHHFTIPPS